MERTLEDWIKSDEGFRALPYKCPADKWTIGYGRNLSDRGISQAEAQLMIENDILICKQEMEAFEWYYGQPPGVRDALVNMCFNLGLPMLLRFKRMLAALVGKDYNQAAIEALDSRWANQVGDRAKRVACSIRAGK